LIPFFLVALILGSYTIWLEKNHVGAQGQDFLFSPLERVLIAGRALWFYVGKFIWPQTLIFIYPRWIIDSQQMQQFLFPASFFAVLLSLWVGRKQIGKGPLVAVLFFIVNLLPALGFINFYMMLFSFVADHLLYISILGLIVLIIPGFIHFWTKRIGIEAKQVGIFLSMIVIVVCIMRTWNQCKIYKDEIVFYSNIIEENPDCWMAYNNRGRIYESRGEFDLAFDDYNNAINTNLTCQTKEENSSCMRAYNNRGIIYKFKGKSEKALADFNKAIEINEAFHKAYLNRGAVYFAQGKLDLALEDFKKVVQIMPSFEKGYMNMGLIYHTKKDYVMAIDHYSNAIKINPDYVKAYVNRGAVFFANKELSRAITDYSSAISINPGYAMAYFNRSLVYSSLSRFNDALQDALKAKALGSEVDLRYIEDLQQAVTGNLSIQEALPDLFAPVPPPPKLTPNLFRSTN